MGSYSGLLHRPLTAAAAAAVAAVSADVHDRFPVKFNPPLSSQLDYGSVPLKPSIQVFDASSTMKSCMPSETSLKFLNSSIGLRNFVPTAESQQPAPHNLPRPSSFSDMKLLNSSSASSSPPASPAVLRLLYQYANLTGQNKVHKSLPPGGFTSPPTSPSDILFEWHLPRDSSGTGERDSSGGSAVKPKTTVVLLGWLGAKQKHLRRYAEWYTARGFQAVTFTFPMSDIVSYTAGGKAEQHVDLLVNHLAHWVGEKQGNRLVFHTFSNTGWLTYGVILEKLSHQEPSVFENIKGCIVDSAPVAAPDPQVWASGFSAALLKKQSVATKGSVRVVESGVIVVDADHAIGSEPKPAVAEAALLVILEKFFKVVLNLPTVNKKLEMADKGKGVIGSSSGSGSGVGPLGGTGSSEGSVEREIEPLWAHVTVLQAFEGGGGNKRFTCNFCQRPFTGSYTRVKAHLLHITGAGITRCSKVDPSLRRQLLKKQEEFEKKKGESKDKAAINIPIFGGYREDMEKKRKLTLSDFGMTTKSSTKGMSNIEKSFNKVGREEMDRKVGRFFFSSSLPFNVARNPYFKDLVTSLANCNLSGYVPPSSEKLRTLILTEEKGNIQKLLEHKKFAWESSGVSIVSDGWTDIQRRPLINFIAYSVSGPIFLKSVDASGEVKSATYLKDLFVEVIKEVGAENVVQIITDNASNCKSAGLSLECEFPHIFWTPCMAHSLNLALLKLCNPSEDKENPRAMEMCSWIEQISRDCIQVRNFVMNHHLLNAIFNKHSKLKLLKVADTRFASMIVMVKRFLIIKSALIQMVTDACWDLYRGNKPEDQAKAQAVKHIILDDCWWDKVTYFLEFTEPIWEMLREVDKDAPMLHKVYEMWDVMIEKVEGIILKHEAKEQYETSTFFEHVHSILVTRWNKSNTPLHCLAHSLNPKYYGMTWLKGGVGRVAPNHDPEIAKNRQLCFGRIYRDSYQLKEVNSEFAKFCSGRLDCLEALAARDYQEPLDWWLCFGTEMPVLQKLASKLLAQPATSSCCERNWSTYSQIHNIKRNKLLSSRAEDLVYVHSNLRLLSRKNIDYCEGSSKFWDANPEEYDIDDGEEIHNLNMELTNPMIPSDDIEEVDEA